MSSRSSSMPSPFSVVHRTPDPVRLQRSILANPAKSTVAAAQLWQPFPRHHT